MSFIRFLGFVLEDRFGVLSKCRVRVGVNWVRSRDRSFVG